MATTELAVKARMLVERRIVRRTVEALLAAGFLLSVDGDEGCAEIKRSEDVPAILDALDGVDVVHLYTWRNVPWSGGEAVDTGWVYFVYGNDGYDVICDYTTNLETALAPVCAYADTLADGNGLALALAGDVAVLLDALKDLVTRCDGDEGMRADGSNIQTMQAHAALAKVEGGR